MNRNTEISLNLQDTQWEYDYIDHDRIISRAVVFDDAGFFYFARIRRNDEFGNATLIETSGGGVEEGESLTDAVKRELMEELGIQVNILCKIGVVNDYYNLIHRHNINNYFLCRVESFCERKPTDDEREKFHLSVLKLTYDDAISEYKKRSASAIGKLIANRELPVLSRANDIIGRNFRTG